MKNQYKVLGAMLLLGATVLSHAGEKVSLVLNWTPTADHSPIYYARAQGWYKQADIDLDIESGRGSAVSAERVGAGSTDMGIADLPTAMQARGKGADLTAVMVIYANSPQGFYWLKSSGIKGPKDFPGHKIGNPPGDAARLMWPAFARKVGIDPGSVTFVNVSPPAKVAALKSKAVDIVSDFYNEHDLKVHEFGTDLGFLPWRDVGVNVYGNSLVVNSVWLAAHKDVVARFVAVTQRAYGACVKNFDPCLQALMADVSGLNADNQHDQWNRIKTLMRDPATENVALGAFDAKRVESDYALVQSLIGVQKSFDPGTLFTNQFLDVKVKMTGN